MRRSVFPVGLLLLMALPPVSAQSPSAQSTPMDYLAFVRQVREAKKVPPKAGELPPIVGLIQSQEYLDAIQAAVRRKDDTALLELYRAKHGEQWPRTVKGTSLLAYAVMNGDADIVKQLLARKADPNAANEEGWTPLHYAAESGNVVIVKMLLEKGAEVDVRTERFGETPLMLACGLFSGGRNDAGKCARLLLEKGANANAATNDGVTPLMYAAHAGRVETVKLLLAKGAGAGAKDFKGKMALDGILEFDKIDSEGKVTVTQDSVTIPTYRTTVMGALIQHGKVNAGEWPSTEMERKVEADGLNDFQTILRLLREAVKPPSKQKAGTRSYGERRRSVGA